MRESKKEWNDTGETKGNKEERDIESNEEEHEEEG